MVFSCCVTKLVSYSKRAWSTGRLNGRVDKKCLVQHSKGGVTSSFSAYKPNMGEDLWCAETIIAFTKKKVLDMGLIRIHPDTSRCLC